MAKRKKKEQPQPLLLRVHRQWASDYLYQVKKMTTASARRGLLGAWTVCVSGHGLDGYSETMTFGLTARGDQADERVDISVVCAQPSVVELEEAVGVQRSGISRDSDRHWTVGAALTRHVRVEHGVTWATCTMGLREAQAQLDRAQRVVTVGNQLVDAIQDTLRAKNVHGYRFEQLLAAAMEEAS